MTSYNLALLPELERRQIELKRQASLLIHNMKRGKINRGVIVNEISKLPASERNVFKEYLNFYKGYKQ